jgi:hypothetical protein
MVLELLSGQEEGRVDDHIGKRKNGLIGQVITPDCTQLAGTHHQKRVHAEEETLVDGDRSAPSVSQLDGTVDGTGRQRNAQRSQMVYPPDDNQQRRERQHGHDDRHPPTAHLVHVCS